jgi:hypothetical protein
MLFGRAVPSLRLWLSCEQPQKRRGLGFLKNAKRRRPRTAGQRRIRLPVANRQLSALNARRSAREIAGLAAEGVLLSKEDVTIKALRIKDAHSVLEFD